jgi:hypothetical protein
MSSFFYLRNDTKYKELDKSPQINLVCTYELDNAHEFQDTKKIDGFKWTTRPYVRKPHMLHFTK